MQHRIELLLRNSILERVHGLLPTLVPVVLVAFLAATPPAMADGSSLVNHEQFIRGPIEVHLVFTDPDGKQQDYSLTSVPPDVFKALTPLLQAESKLPLLETPPKPRFFDALWSVIDHPVCADMVADVKQSVNFPGNQAYNISCRPMIIGILSAAIWKSMLSPVPDAPPTEAVWQLVLTYYVPPVSSIPFRVTTPTTCSDAKANDFCAHDPAYTLLYHVSLQLTVNIGDPNAVKLLPTTKAVPSWYIGPEVLLDHTGYEKKLGALEDKIVQQLSVDAALFASGNWEAALVHLVVQAIADMIKGGPGAMVADIANAGLYDSVSAALSVFPSAALSGGANGAAEAFNLLFAALESGNSIGFTKLDVEAGPKESLVFKLTYPPPAKPELRNTIVAQNKGIHLSPPSIGTGVRQVEPGVPFMVEGNNFDIPYTNALDISWNHTVAGIGKTQMQWGPKGGPMQDTNVVLGNFRADNLKPDTTYQFRVHECDGITCAPWSDWLTATTEGSGSNEVAIWLDGDSLHPIGNGTILPNGSFVTKVIIPAGTTSGAHTLHAGPASATLPAKLATSHTLNNPASTNTPPTNGGALASLKITVTGSGGGGATISVIDSQTQIALTPPVQLLYPSTFTLRGDHFKPAVIVTLHIDSATGPKLGTATPNKSGSFEASFRITLTTLNGNHKLVAVQDVGGSSVQATEEVNLASQPK